MWEGVGDWTELQHIDPHSIGHNRISLPFSWAAQPGARGPASLGAGFLYRILSLTGLVSKLLSRGPEGSLCWVLAFSTASCLQLVWSPNWLNFLCTQLYNSSLPTFLWTSQSHSFNPSTVKVIFWYSLGGCSCYLHRCISYFDSPAGS